MHSSEGHADGRQLLIPDERSELRKIGAALALVVLLLSVDFVGASQTDTPIAVFACAFVPILLAALTIHEVIHYVAWKRVTGVYPEKFRTRLLAVGLRGNGTFTARQAALVSALPTVLIPLLLIATIITSGVARWLLLECFICITFGSAGDLYFFRRLRRLPAALILSDTYEGYVAAL
jgi:hypothetical protein